MSFSPQMEAFRVSSRAIGIDLMRSVIQENLGTYVASEAATFRAGMLVQLNSSQEIEACGTGGNTEPFGFTKYTKAQTWYASVVGEQIQLNALVATNLKHANVLTLAADYGVRVFNLTTNVAYTEGAGNDYSCNYTNGTIVRDAASTIVDGQIVGVDYSYQVTETELQFEGRNFWNFVNDVSIQGNLVSVITGWSTLFTTQYDPTITYVVNMNLNAGTSAAGLTGLVTSGGAGPYIGTVFQVPTADDPFLGIRYAGGQTS